jgi:hypothetical protein
VIDCSEVVKCSRCFVLSTKYFVLSARRIWRRISIAALFCIHFVAASAFLFAAPPKVTYFFPAGAQQGQSIVVTAGGDFSIWPVQVWLDRPGVSFVAEKDKGKFKVEVAADAGAGIYWVRMVNADGAATLRPFVVGTLPEVMETETNDLPDKPQAVESRVVVNGKLSKSGDVDGYRVNLKRGQTLVAAVEANSQLGAPMDAVLQICELVESHGRTEAFVVEQNHDAVGLDPQIAFTAERDGAYLVRLFAFPATPDQSIRFAGGDDYVYRLTLTTGPYIDHVLPLSVPREESQVRLGGWNLGVNTTAIVPPLSSETSSLALPDEPSVWIWRPQAAGAVLAPRVAHATVTGESVITTPMTVSGRLAKVGQVDLYSFEAKKDQKLRFKVAAKSLGYPTDAVISVFDKEGKPIAEADDASRDDRDPVLDFSPPADGPYTLAVRDLANRGDLRLVYRLTGEPVVPNFSLSLPADSFVVEKGKPLEISVNVNARDGLKEPIEIRAIGLPAGLTAEPVKFEPSGETPAATSGEGRRRRSSTPQASGPSVKLVLKADETATAGGFPFRIEGRKLGESAEPRTARFSLNLPLAGSHYAAWLTVKGSTAKK